MLIKFLANKLRVCSHTMTLNCLVKMLLICFCIHSEAQTRLIELEDQAKTAGKGKWGTPTPEEAIRDVTWTVDNARTFVDSFKGEALPG